MGHRYRTVLDPMLVGERLLAKEHDLAARVHHSQAVDRCGKGRQGQWEAMPGQGQGHPRSKAHTSGLRPNGVLNHLPIDLH